MRVSLDSIAIAALLASIPFASVVRSYPTGGYINVVDTSKRGIPKPGGAPTNPFKTPFDTPSPPSSHGSPGGAAPGWRNFADGDLTLANAAQDKVRLKGQGYIQDLDNAITHQSPSKNIDSVTGNGYSGQRELNEPPQLKIQQQKSPYAEFGLDLRRNWRGDDIKKPGSDTIVKTYENYKQRAVIISKSFNQDQDKGGKLSWSAIVMDNMQKGAVMAKKSVSDTRYIIRNNIEPYQTKASGGEILDTIPAIQGAFAAKGAETTKTLTLNMKTTDKVELQQVSILSAQTHVARVLQMLKDYRSQFGDLTITKLHLQHRDNVQSDSQYNIIIELGK